MRTTSVDLITANSINDEDKTDNRIGNSKVNEAKVDAKTTKSKSQDKSKGKNLVMFFSPKSEASSSESGFFTPGARQAFTKLN